MTVDDANTFATSIASASRAIMSSVALAVKSGGGGLSEEQFAPVWEELQASAKQLLADANKAYGSISEERLPAGARDALLAHLRTTLEFACTPASDLLDAIRPKQKKRDAASGKKMSDGGGRAGPKVKVKDEVLACALDKLAKFDFNIFDANFAF